MKPYLIILVLVVASVIWVGSNFNLPTSPVPALETDTETPSFPEVITTDSSSTLTSLSVTDLASSAAKFAQEFSIIPLATSFPNSSSSSSDDLIATSKTVTATSQADTFNIIWPDYYRNFLVSIRDRMITDGFLSSDSYSSFANEDIIYEFLYKYLDYYKTLASLSDQEYQTLKNQLDNVPSLKADQHQAARKSLSLLRGILDTFINQADAAWVSAGAFCYKDLAPLDITPGYASPVFCCNCGLQIFSFGTVFQADCGPFGSICQIPLGCLNSVCAGRGNAIWDASTSMCGCG